MTFEIDARAWRMLHLLDTMYFNPPERQARKLLQTIAGLYGESPEHTVKNIIGPCLWAYRMQPGKRKNITIDTTPEIHAMLQAAGTATQTRYATIAGALVSSLLLAIACCAQEEDPLYTPIFDTLAARKPDSI